MKTESAIYGTLADAFKAARYGVIYVYVSPALSQGWLAEADLPELKWYEKMVLIDRHQSRGFLREIRADEDFVFCGVGHGLIMAYAREPAELQNVFRVARAWAEPINRHLVRRGMIKENGTGVFEDRGDKGAIP